MIRFLIYLGLFQIVNCGENLALNQLPNWFAKNPENDFVRNSAGACLPSLTASLSVGENGPIPIKDTNLVDHLAHFVRERVPERIVHAKGGGAFGVFEVHNDITKYTKAKLFSEIKKKTPIFMRFSTALGLSGSPDTTRDSRGFAVKFYTEDGNLDLVGINFPMFWFNDPMLFMSLIKCGRLNPSNNIFGHRNGFWDFVSLREESAHALTFLMSDRGIPDGFRHMHGYGVHTYKMVNDKNEIFYIKFVMKTDQGVKTLSVDNATLIAGRNPNYSIEDLFNAIATGNYPSWTMYIKVMSMEQAKNISFSPFDITKTWPNKDFPEIKVGKLTLNENPNNYFRDVVQSGFSPGNLVPGIEVSADRMLTGRAFGYPDSQRARMGTNFLHLKVNSPRIPKEKIRHYNRDGLMHPDDLLNLNAGPNYFPNSFGGADIDQTTDWHGQKVCGDVDRKDVVNDNFSQAKFLWEKVFKPDEKQRVAENIADGLRQTTDKRIPERLLNMLKKVSEEYHDMVKCEYEKALKLPLDF